MSNVDKIRSEALGMVRHLMHDHPLTSLKRKQGLGNMRKRSRWHMLPRLWHRKQVYVYYLELYNPLWLGEDGVIYREYVDMTGNSYFMEAEIWLRDEEGLNRISVAVSKLDPCNVHHHVNA